MGELEIWPLPLVSHFPNASRVTLFDAWVVVTSYSSLLEKPPPCTLFYLADNCKHGPECRYAHDYILDAGHYEEMKNNAKKSPCPNANRSTYLWIFLKEKSQDSSSPDGICTWGEYCCYGHTCPSASKCIYLKLGMCRFVGGTPRSTLFQTTRTLTWCNEADMHKEIKNWIWFTSLHLGSLKLRDRDRSGRGDRLALTPGINRATVKSGMRWKWAEIEQLFTQY